MAELSILIPGRNEEFMARTIDDIIANITGDTEIIVVLDGYWPDPVINDHPRVTLIHNSESVGQRAATNQAARLSQSKYIMKCDAHCAFDKGFDTKLMADCCYDWTVVPRMYNLHAFDWQCRHCGNRTYMGPYPTKCEKCNNVSEFDKVLVWLPRLSRKTDHARFDNDLHFQYWNSYGRRPEVKVQGNIADTMCQLGAAWFMHRERFWELGGCDEAHGSWGQMGVEMSCKAWLSGGRQVVNKNTWFSHMFRTQPGFNFPYPQNQARVDKAREYSKWLWWGDRWDKAIRPFSWIIDHFAPVPDWTEDIPRHLEAA